MNNTHHSRESLRLSLCGLHGGLAAGKEPLLLRITAYDHVGIRVSDRAAALRFYASLGFVPDADYTDERVAEVMAGTVRLNLIFNGTARPLANNILLDDKVKWPGLTHAAFVVDRLEDVIAWAAKNGVAITEGPVDWGRRLTCFLRDPDGNVLEFNEIKDGAETAR
jgi:catechol 2,3-dioxygenase-like lactoylglutathione lyase family enzyme